MDEALFGAGGFTGAAMGAVPHERCPSSKRKPSSLRAFTGENTNNDIHLKHILTDCFNL